ncbi:MAG: glutamate--tRNA ligase family protein [Candidatus Hodgkinia cicadicola]
MHNIVRVRLAPSPTGCPHLGNLLVGAYNVLFKLKYGASLILRLEDTDISKACAASTRKVYSAFDAIGIRFDESPARVNKFGPYIQTQRQHIHSYYHKLLAASGLAFWCRCKWKRVSALKQVNLALGDASVYDGKCLRSKLGAHTCHKLRLKTPRVGVFRVNNHVSHWSDAEMQPLWARSMPTFHLASVVDDHLMRVSHVLRGRDWVASLSKHMLLYAYLSFKPPKFYHLPLLSCAKGLKLSKRFLGYGVDACLSLGILPYTILIYLVSLITGAESHDLKDAIPRFSLCAINKVCMRINKTRLLALNKRVLMRACLASGLFESILGRANTQRALALCAEKSVSLANVYKQMSFVFCFNTQQPAQFIASRRYVVLATLVSAFKHTLAWNKSDLTSLHTLLCAKLNLSLRTLLTLIYSAVFGTRDSISLYDSFLLLGKEAIVFRLELALSKLQRLWM